MASSGPEDTSSTNCPEFGDQLNGKTTWMGRQFELETSWMCHVPWPLWPSCPSLTSWPIKPSHTLSWPSWPSWHMGMSYLKSLSPLYLENIAHRNLCMHAQSLQCIGQRNSCKSIAWFCSLYWTLNESESEFWMYIGRIAPNLKKSAGSLLAHNEH